MSSEKIPRPAPRLASSHTRPAEPFLPADDVEDVPPEEVHELVEPTLAAVHRSVVRLEQQQAKLLERVDAHIATDERRSGLIHEELALLRADLGLRVTSAERDVRSVERKVEDVAAKTLPQKVGGVSGKAAVGLSVVTGVVTILAQLAALFKPGAVGPLEQLLSFLRSFGGP